MGLFSDIVFGVVGAALLLSSMLGGVRMAAAARLLEEQGHEQERLKFMAAGCFALAAFALWSIWTRARFSKLRAAPQEDGATSAPWSISYKH